MHKDYIDYEGNDNTIEKLRDYKKQLESYNLTKEQQEFFISQLIDEIVEKALESLQKESDELDKLTAMYNLLLAVGSITTDKKEEFRKIKTYKTNSISYFIRNSNDLVRKMYKFKEEVKND